MNKPANSNMKDYTMRFVKEPLFKLLILTVFISASTTFLARACSSAATEELPVGQETAK